MDPTLPIRVLLVLIDNDPSLAIEYAGTLDAPVDLVKMVANWDPAQANEMLWSELVTDGIKETEAWLRSQPTTPTTPG